MHPRRNIQARKLRRRREANAWTRDRLPLLAQEALLRAITKLMNQMDETFRRAVEAMPKIEFIP